LPTVETHQRLDPAEAQWIRSAQDGDRAAFARLIESHYERLHRWLYHLTHDGHAAEDLTQETFLKAFANLQRFAAGSNFRAWLFRIAHNTFLNQRRSAARQKGALPEELCDRTTPLGTSTAELSPCTETALEIVNRLRAAKAAYGKSEQGLMEPRFAENAFLS